MKRIILKGLLVLFVCSDALAPLGVGALRVSAQSQPTSEIIDFARATGFKSTTQPQSQITIEDQGRLYIPPQIASSPKLPIMVILHGWHAVCHNGTGTEPPTASGEYNWPCQRPGSTYTEDILNYQG